MQVQSKRRSPWRPQRGTCRCRGSAAVPPLSAALRPLTAIDPCPARQRASLQEFDGEIDGERIEEGFGALSDLASGICSQGGLRAPWVPTSASARAGRRKAALARRPGVLLPGVPLPLAQSHPGPRLQVHFQLNQDQNGLHRWVLAQKPHGAEGGGFGQPSSFRHAELCAEHSRAAVREQHGYIQA